MNERVYYADAELPFHVWVKEPVTGGKGYRWVLRDRRMLDANLHGSDVSYASRSHDKP